MRNAGRSGQGHTENDAVSTYVTDECSGPPEGSLRDMRGVDEAESGSSLCIPPLQWGRGLTSIIIIIIIIITIEQTKNFKYLGCKIYNENEKDIQQTLPKFAQILGILNNYFKPTSVQKFSRVKVHNALAVPILSYGSEIGSSEKAIYTNRNEISEE
jgi:hypothetical protein